MELKGNIIDGYSQGGFSVEKLYVVEYKDLSSNYYFKPERDIDIGKTDFVGLKKEFPDSIIKTNNLHYCKDKEGKALINLTGYQRVVDVKKGETTGLSFNLFMPWCFCDVDSTTIALYYNEKLIDPEAVIEKIAKYLQYEEKEKKEATIELVGYSGGDGYYTTQEVIKATTIDLDKHYNDDFKAAYEKTANFIQEKSSGLILWRGMCGTGKTSAIRSLITAMPGKSFIYLPLSLAANLDSPELLGWITSNKDSVLIIEDAEALVKDRSSNFTNAVSSLLNLTDGLLGDVLGLTLIITLNASLEEVDEALLRPGRCIVNYEFKPLSANKVEALTGVAEERTLAEIFNGSEEEEKPKKAKKKIGF